ncbi:MAG: 50S ribosomal protein L32e (modular protein) [Candidatus Thorarchaeota archaeon]|nr:MAG: 50S ribosomal protein L32e (modular protein) [Candidatus Thorarchaeota archaeon]
MSKKPKLSDIPGVGPSTAESLEEAGYKTVLKLSRADPKELAEKVSGVGAATAKKMIAAAKKLLPEESKDTKPKAKKSAKKTKKEPKKTKKPELQDISGVGPSTVESLKAAGYKSVLKVSQADPKELAEKVDGVGAATAKKMIAAAKKMLPKEEEEAPKAKPKPKEKPKKEPKAEPTPKPKPKKKKKEKKKKEEPEFPTRETLHDPRLRRISAEMKKRKPAFRHEQAHRWKRVSDSWRKVRGIDSATREKKKGRIAMVSSGYRTPKAVRGLHPSGYIEVRVERPEDIDEKEINPDIHAIRIGATVGGKKRQAIIEKADAMLLRVLNPGVSEILDEEEIFSELDGLEDLEVD